MWFLPGHIKLVLVSGSPRRRQLLAEAGIKFDTAERNFDESFPPVLKDKEIAEFLALSKARQISGEFGNTNTVTITADTIVWCNGHVLGKPSDRIRAEEILRMISGNTHKVITGICLSHLDNHHVFSETTKVTFDTLPDEVIDYYIRNFRPYDKAGAYGIQEWIGIVGCRSIEGCYFNVVGMPVNRFLRELKEFIESDIINIKQFSCFWQFQEVSSGPMKGCGYPF